MAASTPRRGNALAALVAAALALGACSGAPVSPVGPTTGSASPTHTLDATANLAKQSIVVSTWANYLPPTTAADFTKATKAKVRLTTHATEQEVMERLTGPKPGLDVAMVSGPDAQRLQEAGLLEPIDPRLIPNLAQLYPQARDLAFDPGTTFSVPYAWGTTGICYRKDLLTQPPDSWNDVLTPNAKNAGKVLMLSAQPWLNLPAAKSLKLSANTTKPADLTKITAKLKAATRGLLGFDNTTFTRKLASGEATMAVAWDNWCNYSTSKDVTFVVPREGSDLRADTLVVLKSSKSKEAAMAFINQLIGKPAQEWLTYNVLTKSVNQKVGDAAAKTLGKIYPSLALTAEELAGQEALVDIGEAGEAAYAAIAAKVAGT